MKLLTFVDVHGDMKQIKQLCDTANAEDVDLVICAGDITNFGTNQKAIVKGIAASGRPTLIIHGNHENYETLEADCEKYDNMIFLHSASFEIDDYLFFGYGGGGFSYTDESFESISDEFSSAIKIKKKENKKLKTILIVHGPPYGTDADFTNDTHVGNKDYTDFIQSKSVDLVVCGHIHEAAGSDQKRGKSRIINPGPEGRIVVI
ncbi:MAG: metallophosphoesterase family protein [Nanoarchaeota archaeon]